MYTTLIAWVHSSVERHRERKGGRTVQTAAAPHPTEEATTAKQSSATGSGQAMGCGGSVAAPGSACSEL